jgi:hypothetical protein
MHGSSYEDRCIGVGVRTHMYSEEDACLVARYIGVAMRTYSSSGLVAACTLAAATAIYVLVATAYLLGHTAVVAS